MSIKTPDERVYYYECSYGKYRLTIFIPPGELLKLVKTKKINKQIITDYPDGVDLRVSETDYQDFHEIYGYRPETNPKTSLKIFYAYLSSTKDWRQFHGSGLIPATKIDQKTSLQLLTPTQDKPTTPPTKKVTNRKIPQTDSEELLRHRIARKNQHRKNNQLENQLKRINIKEINPKKTIQKQQFQIQYTEGENITKVFTRIQHRRPKK